MTHEEFTTKLDEIAKIENLQTRSYKLENLTNTYYANEMQGMLKRDMDGVSTYRSVRDVTAQGAQDAYEGANVGIDVDAGAVADIAEATADAERGAGHAMATQGGNRAWLDAIELARIGITPEGVERTLRIRGERRVQSSRGSMQARRRAEAGAVQARKARRKAVQAKKPKYARRGVAVPPSQRGA